MSGQTSEPAAQVRFCLITRCARRGSRGGRRVRLGVPVVPSGQNFSHLLDHLRAVDTSSPFHASGMNLPQGAYNP